MVVYAIFHGNESERKLEEHEPLVTSNEDGKDQTMGSPI